MSVDKFAGLPSWGAASRGQAKKKKADKRVSQCRSCRGRGYVDNMKCAGCKGKGWA